MLLGIRVVKFKNVVYVFLVAAKHLLIRVLDIRFVKNGISSLQPTKLVRIPSSVCKRTVFICFHN